MPLADVYYKGCGAVGAKPALDQDPADVLDLFHALAFVGDITLANEELRMSVRADVSVAFGRRRAKAILVHALKLHRNFTEVYANFLDSTQLSEYDVTFRI